ncbi:euchromatin binding [Fragilaria crotonensis]|nr:euchromatin binding [Fragilaria crotonensis]
MATVTPSSAEALPSTVVSGHDMEQSQEQVPPVNSNANPVLSNTNTTSTSNKKRRLSPTLDTPSIPQTLIPAFSQAAAGFPYVQTSIASGIIPTAAQVSASSKKMVQETPPMVHLSKADTAPQLKIENFFTLKGGMRGYRTCRASHGVQAGEYYFECWIQPGPTVDEIKALLPPHVRLAPKLKAQLQAIEELEKSKASSSTSTIAKNTTSTPTTVGGHTRIGWSMRLGDLQAPVGYDKWSYGYRDISGSRVHNSKRDDDWGSEPYGPGDVVGFAISLSPPSTTASSSNANSASVEKEKSNQIYFFRNGAAMGHSILSRGKREGGAAFEDIAEGMYYPAISVYLGGSVRANFGPHFVYNPRKLPHGVKVKPVSELCEKPPSMDMMKEILASRISKLPRKTDDALVKALEEAMMAEAEIRNEAYQQHYQQHVQDVRKQREARNLSTNDLDQSS